MFTLRNETERDFLGTLKKVAEIGYDGVELAGYGGLTAVELKQGLDDLGLRVAASHIRLPILENDLEEEIEYQKILGNTHIVCPNIPPEKRTEEGYGELITFLNETGKRCHEEGITFSYHNHDHELVKLENGKQPLHWILEETNPDWVQTELDIYWLTKAGEDPVEWVKRYQNRTPLVHLKDMTTDGEQFFAELGTGGVNVEGVMEEASKSNVEWWVVEQDQSKRSTLESIEISLKYLRVNMNTSV